MANNKPSSEWHRLTNVDASAMHGTCSKCGPVDLCMDGNNIRCSVVVRNANRRKKLRQRYGITNEAEIGRADGRCEICKTAKAHVIDHDHKTGDVRGKLCGQCNTALGMARDSTKVLRNMIRYLERGLNRPK